MKDWIIRFWMPIVLIICGIIAIVRIASLFERTIGTGGKNKKKTSDIV